MIGWNVIGCSGDFFCLGLKAATIFEYYNTHIVHVSTFSGCRTKAESKFNIHAAIAQACQISRHQSQRLYCIAESLALMSIWLCCLFYR